MLSDLTHFKYFIYSARLHKRLVQNLNRANHSIKNQLINQVLS